MLRMKFEKQIFANVCFTKKCNLELFDEHFRDSKYVTSTQQTALQNKINDDDDFIIIFLDVFSNMKKNSNHDDNSQTKHCILEHIFEILKFRNFRISSFLNNENDHNSQLKNRAIDFDHLNNNVQSSANFSRFFKTKSIHSKYKRQRFLIVNPTNNSFDRHQIKRRSSEICFTQIFVSHIVEFRIAAENTMINQINFILHTMLILFFRQIF